MPAFYATRTAPAFTVLEPRLVYAEGIRLAKPGLVADRENFSAINFIYRPKRGAAHETNYMVAYERIELSLPT